MQMIVVEGHVATYSDPIIVKTGDLITLIGETDEWDGHVWLWAEGVDGKGRVDS